MALSPNDGIVTKKYNLNCIYKTIKKYYKEKLDIILDDKTKLFDAKNAVENKSEDEFSKLTELIAGIAAQCKKREFYLEIMQNMTENEFSEIFNILTERLSNYSEINDDINNSHNNQYLDDSEEEELKDKLELNNNIADLEMDKYLLNQKIINKINEVNELKILVDKKEKIIKESEEKYNILYESINLDKIKQFNTTLNINSDDALNLTIQLSELKGILEGKEKNFNKYKE